MKLFLGELPPDIPVEADLMDLAASLNEVFRYHGFDAMTMASRGFCGTLTMAAETASAATMPMSDGWLAKSSRS